MIIIGEFTKNTDSFTGRLTTLMLKIDITITPSDMQGESTPDFIVTAKGGKRIGAAWSKISRNENPYLSVSIDDPMFPATVYARLMEHEGKYQLIWSRAKG